MDFLVSLFLVEVRVCLRQRPRGAGYQCRRDQTDPSCTHVLPSDVDDPRGQTTGHEPGEVSESNTWVFPHSIPISRSAAALTAGTVSNDAQGCANVRAQP